MRTTRGYWLMAMGVAVVLAAVPAVPTLAGEYEKAPAPPAEKKMEEPKETKESAEKPAAPAKKPAEAKRPAGMVGTVVAVVPESRTLVVDIPVRKDVLRLGATVTEKTKIRAGNALASLGNLKEGDRVRVQFRRVAGGDEATMVQILQGSQG